MTHNGDTSIVWGTTLKNKVEPKGTEVTWFKYYTHKQMSRSHNIHIISTIHKTLIANHYSALKK